jgi:hypothetical protein
MLAGNELLVGGYRLPVTGSTWFKIVQNTPEGGLEACTSVRPHGGPHDGSRRYGSASVVQRRSRWRVNESMDQ